MGYSNFAENIEILESGQKGDRTSRVCDTLIALLVVINIIAIALESVSDFSVKYADQFYAIEFFSVVIFSIEYLTRLWASAAKMRLRIKYLAVHAWDICSALVG